MDQGDRIKDLTTDRPVILLADDEACLRTVTAEILEGIGCTVLQPDHGRTAMSLFEKHQHDIVLVLLDVMMPHLNGIEVAKRMREQGSNIPIIFISGYAKEHLLGTDKQVCNSIFFSKPLNYATFVSHIETYLQGSVNQACVS